MTEGQMTAPLRQRYLPFVFVPLRLRPGPPNAGRNDNGPRWKRPTLRQSCRVGFRQLALMLVAASRLRFNDIYAAEALRRNELQSRRRHGAEEIPRRARPAHRCAYFPVDSARPVGAIVERASYRIQIRERFRTLARSGRMPVRDPERRGRRPLCTLTSRVPAPTKRGKFF